MERYVVDNLLEYIDIYNGDGDLECYRLKKKEMYNELVEYLTNGMKDDETSLGDYYRFFLANVYLYVKELKNLELGFKLAKEVADRDNTIAQVLVGNLYEDGKGVKKNMDEAYKYYKLAADKGSSDAIDKMKLKYMYSCEEADQKEYNYWLQKSAEAGDLNDLNTIILGYKFNNEYDKVYKLCLELINKCARTQKYYNYSIAFKSSLRILGELYIKGLGVEKNVSKGLNILENLANSNDTTAISMLGFMYIDGDGLDKDFDKGVKYLKIAAKEYDYTAQNKLEELGIKYE